MLFRFTGTYTGGRTSISYYGAVFEGREPAEVTDPDGVRRLSNHPEFERVTKAVAPVEPPADLPFAAKRGRPRKK